MFLLFIFNHSHVISNNVYQYNIYQYFDFTSRFLKVETEQGFFLINDFYLYNRKNDDILHVYN